MIALTDEMRAAVKSRMGITAEYLDPWLEAALVDVLTIAARDQRPAPGPARCSACGRTARHLTPVHELVDGRTTVVARLGPSCYREHLRAGDGRQALPIGGAS